MYLRKNRVRSGPNHRTYLSVAHNVWSLPATGKGKCQSRPVAFVSLGKADEVDNTVAAEIVVALERVYGWTRSGRHCRSESQTRRTAEEVRRKHQPELKALASRRYGLRVRFPDHADRMAYLTALIQAASVEPEPPSHREAPSAVVARLEAHV